MPVYQSEGIEAVDGVEFTKYVGDVVVDGKGELFVKWLKNKNYCAGKSLLGWSGCPHVLFIF